MPVRVNLVDIRAKRVEEAAEREARAKKRPEIKPDIVVRGKVMEPVRKGPRKVWFMADLGLKK